MLQRRYIFMLIVLGEVILVLIVSALTGVGLEKTWLSAVLMGMAGITLFVALFLDAKDMIKRLVKYIKLLKESKGSNANDKRPITYTAIIIGELVLLSAASKLTGVSTQNTWLGAVGVNVVFCTVAVMLLKTAKAKNDANEIKGTYLYLVVFIAIIILILANVMILPTVLSN